MRLGPKVVGFGVLGALGALMASVAPDAAACGGCFPPAGEQQSVVTDHRMILSVSKVQTTLYDQIEYSGSPQSFAWVLPISGTVDVGLSADTLFGALQNLTATVVQAPPDRCPPPPNCGYGYGGEDRGPSSAGGSSSGSSGGIPPVDVLKHETVGPYETVQLRSTDSKALTDWLTQNGFAIPENIKPVIAGYVSEHFDFLALKLLPGKGVTSMRPVRVTSVGASAVLPLRMVAAGTGATVGISLWVLGEGRYEPQNFPFFIIKSEDLLWDWAAKASNYKEVRADQTIKAGGRGWEIESAIAVNRNQLRSTVTNLANVNPQAGSDYAPIEQNGQVVKTAAQVRELDLDTLFVGIADGQDHVTRLRADLAHTALTTDLALVASADQSVLANVRKPSGEKGQPLCAVYSGCNQVGTAPRDEAIARMDSSGGGKESFACATTAKAVSGTSFGSSGFAGIGGLAAFLGFVLVRARRARGR